MLKKISSSHRNYIILLFALLFANTGFGQCGTHLGPYYWGGKPYGLAADSIVPTAHHLADSLGASVIRFTLDCSTDVAYLLSDSCITGSGLTALASRPDFNALLTDLQYKTVIITAYDWASFGDCTHQNFLDTAFYTPANTLAVQQELSDFANYLGQFTTKTFIITNWDNALKNRIGASAVSGANGNIVTRF